MVDAGQAGDEFPQRPRMRFAIDDRRGEIALEPGEDLAVQAAPVALGAFLELGMKVLWDVLECQAEHIDSLEPLWNHRSLVPRSISVNGRASRQRPANREQFPSLHLLT